jgi:hypothetical protein
MLQGKTSVVFDGLYRRHHRCMNGEEITLIENLICPGSIYNEYSQRGTLDIRVSLRCKTEDIILLI